MFSVPRGATALAGELGHLSHLKELKMGCISTTRGDVSADEVAESVAALAAPLSRLTSLTTLRVYEVYPLRSCTPESFQTVTAAIARMPALTDLDLGGLECGHVGGPALAGALEGLTGLMRLGLGKSHFGAQGALELGANALLGLTGLTDLALFDNELAFKHPPPSAVLHLYASARAVITSSLSGHSR